MPTYYKRPWNEERADEHADWGTSIWFFEVGDDGFPMRQLEVYQAGIALHYDAAHMDDGFGGLSEVALDPGDFAPFVISLVDFEQAWVSHRPHNQSQ